MEQLRKEANLVMFFRVVHQLVAIPATLFRLPVHSTFSTFIVSGWRVEGSSLGQSGGEEFIADYPAQRAWTSK